MVLKWKNFNSLDVFFLSMYQVVEELFFFKNMLMVMFVINFIRLVVFVVLFVEFVFGKLMVEKIKFMYVQGKSDYDIVVEFGFYGFWLERFFLYVI